MSTAAALLVLPLLAAPAAAEITVRVSGGRVDLTATAAPLSEVLDRLARQTGMKVVYEGPAPRPLVTLTLRGRTPAETVLGLLEGLGINFALVADPSGARVETLVVAGASDASPSSPAAASASRRAAPVNPRRPFGPPPGAGPEPIDPAFEDLDEDDPAFDEEVFAGLPPGAEAAGAADAAGQPGEAPPAEDVPSVPPPGAGQIPTFQPPVFSASPFTPQPQPFPPVPPGVPGAPPGTDAPPPEENAPPP
jgi:hypothetical protein